MPVGRVRLTARRGLAYTDLALAFLLVCAYLTSEGPRLAHAIVGATMATLISVHLLQHRPWIRGVSRRRLKHPERNLALLNIALAAAFVLAFATGPATWLANAPLGGIHEVAGFASIAFALAHLVANRSRITKLFRGLRRRRPLAS
ncbi:MAG: hypothetical protein ACKOH7_02010 [Solirubrobacterales bacterium]